MSQENVDRFVEAIEAMNRRDIEAVLQRMDPAIGSSIGSRHWREASSALTV